MFWDFMNRVHKLPTFKNWNDEDAWWNEQERKLTDFVYYQLSYMRLGDNANKDLPFYQDPNDEWESCLSPVLRFENGKPVAGLSDGYIAFFEQHLGLGKYVGTETAKKTIDQWYMGHICYNCYEIDLDDEEKDEVEAEGELEKGGERYVCDMDDAGRQFEVDDPSQWEEKVKCPKCGTECGPVMIDEGPEIETEWKFEKGSIAFAHYGRGAGISVRFNENIR